MSLSLTTEVLFWGIGGVAVIAVVNLIWLILLAQKINRLLGKTGVADIEGVLASIHGELQDLQEFREELEKYLETVEVRLKRSVQSVETIRFNPFKGTGDGGNQSFATAFIDEQGNGVVVSSLYSRERVSVFSKPLKSFESTLELTEEEQEVLQAARKKLSARHVSRATNENNSEKRNSE